MITSGIGVACPECGSCNSQTTDSRSSTAFGHPTRKRRRICHCGHTYSTFELSDATLDALFSKVRLADTMQHELMANGGLDASALISLAAIIETLQGVVSKRENASRVNLSDNPAARAKPRRT